MGFSTLVLFTGVAGDFWRDLLSWYGWGAIVAVIAVGTVMLLVHNRRSYSLARLPYPLTAFLALATVSIAWSDYRLLSVGGAIAQCLTTAAAVTVALTVNWAELLRVLGWVFRAILGLSFVFEFIVSAFIRHPIFPVWVVPDDPAHPPKLLYWSRDLLFHGDKIQGIVGNSSLLGMAALLGLIVFVAQLLNRSVGRAGWFWVLVAVAAIALTRSATIFLAIAAVVVVAAAVLVIRAARTPRARAIRYGVIVVIVALGAVIAVVLRTPLLHLLGKSSDFTGRSEIWAAVIHLAQERPGVGWGWISYWAPFVAPFNHLIVKGGVQVLHAHNAWLDVFLQLGIVGLVVFGAFVLSTLVRTWLFAIDRTITAPRTPGVYSWIAVVPLLLFVAQLVQSLAESRLLVEGGWMLLVVWAVKTKWDRAVGSDLSDGRMPARSMVSV
jgi:exopolysaccharide production protein ExoQ